MQAGSWATPQLPGAATARRLLCPWRAAQPRSTPSPPGSPHSPARCCVLSALQRGCWSPLKETDSPHCPPHELSCSTEARSHLKRAAHHLHPPLSDGCVSAWPVTPSPPTCPPASVPVPRLWGPLGTQWVWVPRPWLAVWSLLLLLPLDVQQHEYSYFLFKTNLDFLLSKGLLITKKCLRQEMIDRPWWPLLKNKLAIGSATDKGKSHRCLFMSC